MSISPLALKLVVPSAVTYPERCSETGTLPYTKCFFGLVSGYQSTHSVSQPLCLKVALDILLGQTGLLRPGYSMSSELLIDPC